MTPPEIMQKFTLNSRQAWQFAAAAVVSFHLACWVPGCQWFMILFLYCMFRLAGFSVSQPPAMAKFEFSFEYRLAGLFTGRKSVLFGLGIGLAVYVPHLIFLWTLFGPAAIGLWLVLAFWLGLFLLAGTACLMRFGPVVWAVAAPFFWTGMEYFRSENYYLRFSWLNASYDFSTSAALPYLARFGVYGIGFVLMAWAAYVGAFTALSKAKRAVAGLVLLAVSTFPLWLPLPEPPDGKIMDVTGIQLEGSNAGQVKAALDAAVQKYPKTDLFVLSEDTFEGPVPPEILDWCKTHGKWLAVGGQEPASAKNYFNTVYVVRPDGTIAFEQAKSVPVQFMKDGLPAREQHLWESPWGHVGFGICYDASYTRVTDELIRQGAQALIFPSMDVADWGRAEHELHGRIAPMRAAEYTVPVFRLGSSGISQFVRSDGRVMETAPFPGQDAMLNAQMELTAPGHIPVDRPLTQLALVLTAALILYMIVEAWWSPKLPQ
jgi:apolipoprotein N-acyltransferase